MSTNHIIISYDSFHVDCLKLSSLLDKIGSNFDYIVAPSRGGLLAGCILSHQLNKPLYPIVWSTRDFSKRDKYDDIVQDLSQGKKIVFVDDINDTGRTFSLFAEYVDFSGCNNSKNIIYCSIYEKSTTQFPSTYTITKFYHDRWYVFPWEQ